MQAEMGRVCEKETDIVLLSPAGSGKTVAYLLPLVRRLRPESDGLQAVVVVPSRELAQQSAALLRDMKTGIRGMCLHGGRPAMQEHRQLKEVRPHVVFATPGRLDDHLDKENIRLHAVQVVVVDEFDKSLEAGFEDEMLRISRRLTGRTVKWLLSATDSEKIADIVDVSRALRLDYRDAADFSNRSQTFVVPSPQKDKLETLAQLLSELSGRPAMVFVAHRESAERAGAFLKKSGFIAEIYHGGLEQYYRERALYRFRSGGSNVLVATDLAARGLDIPETETIVHYHLPADEAAFIHRNGRATRWESQGAAYLLLGPDELVPAYIGTYETRRVSDVPIRATQPAWVTIYIGRGKKEKISKADVVGFLCKTGQLKREEIGKIEVGLHHAYAAIARKRLKTFLQTVKGKKIKGQKTIFEEMK